MRCLVTGATGFIGSHLCRALGRRGHEVVGAVRAESRHRSVLPSHIPTVEIDYQSRRGTIPRVDAVIHCAYAAGATGDDINIARAVNVEATKWLLSLLQRWGGGLFVLLSSQTVLTKSRSPYAVTKREAEEVLRSNVCGGGTRGLIVRPGLVYGVGHGGLFHNILSSIGRRAVVPVIGGGRQSIQPVHVEDLVRLIMDCVDGEENRGHLDPDAVSELNVGQPEPINLGTFLRKVAVAKGVKRLFIPIPTVPARWLTQTAERLGYSLPVRSSNIEGLRSSARFPVGPEVARYLRPLEKGLTGLAAEERELKWTATSPRSVDVVIVGCGKMGMTHAFSLNAIQNVRIIGLVDPDKRRLKLLESLGLKTQKFYTLEHALQNLAPHAAIVCTPTNHHISLIRALAERQVHMFVEKPAALDRKELVEIQSLKREKGVLIHIGYVPYRYPHLASVRKLIERKGRDKIISVKAFARASHVLSKSDKNWLNKRDVSGGGVILNSGSHVLALLTRILGWPEKISATAAPLYSDGVEDLAIIQLVYPGGPRASCYLDWSASGMTKQENRVEIRFSDGEMVCVWDHEVWHTVDGQAVCLNEPSPVCMVGDGAGSGYFREMRFFVDEVAREICTPGRFFRRTIQDEEGFELEKMLFSISEDANYVSPESLLNKMPPTGMDPRILPLSLENFCATRVADREEIEFRTVSGPVRNANGHVASLVPDFYRYAKLLSDQQYLKLLRSFSPGSLLSSLPMCLRRGIHFRLGGFWHAVAIFWELDIMRAAEKQVSLFPALSELSVGFRRWDVLKAFAHSCSRRGRTPGISLTSTTLLNGASARIAECGIKFLVLLRAEGNPLLEKIRREYEDAGITFLILNRGPSRRPP